MFIGLFDRDYFRLLGQEPVSSCNGEANPCDVVTGRKTQKETDIVFTNLTFSRYYDSGAADPVPWIGPHWRHSYDTTLNRKISNGASTDYPDATVQHPGFFSSSFYTSKAEACSNGWLSIKNTAYRGLYHAAASVFNSETELCDIVVGGEVVLSLPIVSSYTFAPADEAAVTYTVSRPNGAFYLFEEIGPDTFQEVNGYDVRLEKQGDDVVFYDTNGTIDRFVNNQFVQRTLPNKKRITLNYNEQGWLQTVNDASGQTLHFAYNDHGQISSVSHSEGIVQYRYGHSFNLTVVTYEDDSTRQYHYEDTRLPHHLTGITDERGIRYATWTYDDEGKALSSSHAGDTDRTTFEYTENSTIVTDPTGATREYHIGMRNKQLVVTSVTGTPCRDCWKGDASQREYDSNGHLSRVTDWKGNVTTYTHNERGQELSRTEASVTPQARTITTEWHPDFNLPTKIIEPDREIVMTYDANGRMRTRQIAPRSN